jgi:hypothetical protein
VVIPKDNNPAVVIFIKAFIVRSFVHCTHTFVEVHIGGREVIFNIIIEGAAKFSLLIDSHTVLCENHLFHSNNVVWVLHPINATRKNCYACEYGIAA